MSAEDKRKTLLAIFHETKDVFVLKDVEKIGAKRGVVLQSIKDVLQTLVDDDLVHMEKIGSSNYFWSFPSEAAVKLQVEITKLETQLEERSQEAKSLGAQLESKKVGNTDTVQEERSCLVRRLAELDEKLAASSAELRQYAASDPERYEALKQATPVAIDSANRWIDNLHALHDWLRKKFQGMDTQVTNLDNWPEMAQVSTGVTTSSFAGSGPAADQDDRTIAGLHIPGSSTLYTLLSLLQLVAGIAALIAPYRLTDIFFKHHIIAPDLLYEELWRLLAGVLFAGAATAYALKVTSDRQLLAEPLTQRLQLGFVWFALVALVLHLVYLLFIKTLTWWGLLLGAAVVAPTLLLPVVHLSLSGGFGLAATIHGFRTGLGNLVHPRSFSVAGFLYTLLTVAFTVVGFLIVILPKRTLDWTYGYHAGKNPSFLWQWVGAAFFFLFSAITYTLTERSVVGRLHTTVPKVLNVGLLVASLFFILDFGTLIFNSPIAGRWLLPVLFGHWVLVLLASILGLSASPPATAYEYEPLLGEGQV
ncbi:Meiotic nuclear division protein 1-like protein [Auxenochlorella protothecoides]|nr:Meiotic nuclear division protein 1-like protein [Auxenochlorella protothecoides]KFM24714.1 Meiotic nuclear division protein 1-like protein [Auxenochlorella protothecoides]